MSDHIAFGKECVAHCGAPAKSLGGGLCLYVSAQDNSLHIDRSRLLASTSPNLPLPTHDECKAALAGLRYPKRATT